MAELEKEWQATLAELQLQMTRATFNTWLSGSRVVGRENGTLQVQVRHAYAVAWLQNRLHETVLRTVQRRVEGVERVEFVAEVAIPEEEEIVAAPSGEGDEVDVELVSDPELEAFDTLQAGWSMLANYAVDFWTELLGPPAFLTWLAVKAEDIRRKKTVLTQGLRFSVSRLARLSANGNSQAITGVWRTCRSRSMLERGEPCNKCGERGGLIADGACRYWRPGAFDVLQAEGVARVERTGTGLKTVYRVRVFNVLPLLTPAQVARLHPVTQEEHDRWLRRQGLDMERWERLTVESLAGRLLDGNQQLDNIH